MTNGKKKMSKKEAKWNTVLNQYLREKKLYCFYELKQTELDIFSFSKIEKVQWDGLQATEKNGLVWKLSDEDTRPKPCDGLSIPPLPSYLVIKFKDGFYMIRFSEIVRMRDLGIISVKRSLAEKLSEKIIKI
jgi:hypothetical protein